MMLRRAVVTGLLVAAGTGCFGERMANAQLPPPANAVAGDFTPEEWQALTRRKAETVARITEISKAFQTADEAQKQELIDQAEKIQREFYTEVT
ncbi:MAG: hypothetical protein KF861_08325, partial [Planctomycetaceae bacterium]|nr:hypothetical protein [Planctomycetaceae bacterium]